MDLGLDGLIKMFEERFGKRAATLLIALIALGAASWAIHSTVDFIIRPSVPIVLAAINALSGLKLNIGPENFSGWGVFTAVVAVLVFVAILRAAWISDEKWSKKTQIVDREGFRQLLETAQEICRHGEKLEKENAELKGRLGIATVTDEGPSPQALPNSEPETSH